MHSSRMRTVRSSSCLQGGVCSDTPFGQTPPWADIPWADPLPLGRHPLCRHPSGVGLDTPPSGHTAQLPPPGFWPRQPTDQTPQLPPWVCA